MSIQRSRDDFNSLKRYLPRGRVAIVIDYAENYSHKPRYEHQSKYFSQVQTTIIPVVVMMRVEDITNLDETERARLIAILDEHTEPHIISETHFIISPDMQHDNAMVQKALDDFIIPYLKATVADLSFIYVRSDGCKAQFKCAANFYWVSRQKSEGCGILVDWSFFESCHGKCYCDPEGGTLKNAAAQHELHVSEQAKQLKDSELLYKWACNESGLATPKIDLSRKKGRGIYRRFFYFVPSKGTGAVRRANLPEVECKGTSTLHEFVDVGTSGCISTRRAACHQCPACWAGSRFDCVNINYTGKPIELKINKKTSPSAATERVTRDALNRMAIQRAEKVVVDSIICIETHKDEQSYPWVLGTVVVSLQAAPATSSPYDLAAGGIRLEPVREGEPALQVKLLEPIEPGSVHYIPSEIIQWVPARRVRVIDITMSEVRSQGQRAVSQANAALTASRRRLLIEATDLNRIRVEMPTVDDDWQVERVAQYRCVYGMEQWLVKWCGYSEDRNTWEPWENLLSHEVQAEAQRVRNDFLPRTQVGLMKLTLPTIRAATALRSLDPVGRKADLVTRLLAVLEAEAEAATA